MGQYSIVVDENPPADKIQAVRQHLIEYNASHSRIAEGCELAVYVEDETGTLRGGVVAWLWGACMEVEYVWLDESLRGRSWGRSLFQRVEGLARERNCQTIVLDTYSFQAPEFYRKLGFQTLGVVEGYPDGITKVFMVRKVSDQN
jgi:GNAT superfamily N-acetyltransferase